MKASIRMLLGGCSLLILIYMTSAHNDDEVWLPGVKFFARGSSTCCVNIMGTDFTSRSCIHARHACSAWGLVRMHRLPETHLAEVVASHLICFSMTAGPAVPPRVTFLLQPVVGR